MRKVAVIAFCIALTTIFVAPQLLNPDEPSALSIEAQLKESGYEEFDDGWRVTGIRVEIHNGVIVQIHYIPLFVVCVPREGDETNLEAALSQTTDQAKAVAFQNRPSNLCMNETS